MKNEPLNDWYKETFDALSEDPPIDVWQGISANVQGAEPETAETPVVALNENPKSWTKWLKIAAVIAVLLCGGVVALMLAKSPTEQASNTQFLSYVDLVSQYAGQGFSENKNLENIDIFYLPDGTLVYLNKDSRLTYPKAFDKSERVVVLEGEAFFDVQRDEEHPFVIYSGNTKTEVLGTSFNLKAYDKQDEVELTVVSGEVKLSIMGIAANNSSVNLIKGEQGLFNKDKIELSETEPASQEFIAWAHDHEKIAQTELYKKEAAMPSDYIEIASEWTQNGENETVLDGEINNSSTLLVFEKATLKATYLSKSGEPLASKFFDVTETVLPGQSINYEHIMRDWIEGTDNIEVTLENIEIK